MNKRYIIVGAGKNGITLLNRLGKDRVSFFADNNKSIIGKEIEGIKVISLDEIKQYTYDNSIIVSVENKTQLTDQLADLGVENYVTYMSDWRKERMNGIITAPKTADQEKINGVLRSYADRCDFVDPITDIKGFKNVVKECKEDKSLNGCYNILGKDWESLTYGHFDAITSYAHLSEADPILFPIVPHAPFYFDNVRSFNSAVAVSSQFLQNDNKKKFPYIPTFVVGEYMQYVQPDESVKKSAEDKKRTVIVFMHHSVEALKVEHDYRILMDMIFTPLLSKYDRVMLSVYWYDVDDPLYKSLNEAGVDIVSAGFRFDEKFIYRLKNMIDMCDDVVVYGRTSALIYALAMGKKLYYHQEQNSKLVMDKDNINLRFINGERVDAMSSWEDILKKNYGKRFSEYSGEEKKTLDYYFGISVHRSPEEIRLMYEVCKDIWENSNYRESEYPMAVYKTYWQYQMNNDFDKLVMLAEALPPVFWNTGESV